MSCTVTRSSGVRRLADLLTRVSARALARRGGRLVLLIDGLDEYDAPAGAYNPLAAFLPQALPRVRLLSASRPRHPYLEALEARGGALTRIDLDDPSTASNNDATVRALWQREAAALGRDDRFIEKAAASAGGNMQHAVNVEPAGVRQGVQHRRGRSVPQERRAVGRRLGRGRGRSRGVQRGDQHRR